MWELLHDARDVERWLGVVLDGVPADARGRRDVAASVRGASRARDHRGSRSPPSRGRRPAGRRRRADQRGGGRPPLVPRLRGRRRHGRAPARAAQALSTLARDAIDLFGGPLGGAGARVRGRQLRAAVRRRLAGPGGGAGARWSAAGTGRRRAPTAAPGCDARSSCSSSPTSSSTRMTLAGPRTTTKPAPWRSAWSRACRIRRMPVESMNVTRGGRARAGRRARRSSANRRLQRGRRAGDVELARRAAERPVRRAGVAPFVLPGSAAAEKRAGSGLDRCGRRACASLHGMTTTALETVAHWIGGERLDEASRYGEVTDPATGAVTRRVAFASARRRRPRGRRPRPPASRRGARSR